ncbi:MAG: hypothetical protein HQK83_07565 [Fibrobacteria bacterium]|nr:hypothetical protein [Fibrobacteria bacterium]
MTFRKFIIAELFRYKKTYLAYFLTATIAVAAFVFISLTSQAAKRDIQLITKEMGQNVIILPAQTELEDYYSASGNEHTMPEEYADSLAAHKGINVTYHVAVLQKSSYIQGSRVIITGIKPYKGKLESNGRKNPYRSIKTGEVRIGHIISQKTGLQKGDSLSIMGAKHIITKVKHPMGTMDDYRVFVDLDWLQLRLNRMGVIHAVLSLECLCGGVPLSIIENNIRQAVRKILPTVKVVTLRSIALGRYNARKTTDNYGRLVFFLVLFSSIMFIMLHSYSEAASRKREYALMSAIGFPGLFLIKLYLVKSFIITMASVPAGWIIGRTFTSSFGILFTKAIILPDYSLLPQLFIGLFVVVATGLSPALIHALKTDPFEILREE